MTTSTGTRTPAGRARLDRKHGPNRPSGLLILAFLAPTLFLLVTTRIWPFLATIDQAFGTDWNVVGAIGDLFDNPSFVSSIKTTLWFNAIINPLQVFGALALAVLLTQKLPATGLWRMLVFLPVAVPPAVAAVVWGLALRSPDGLINGVFTSLGFEPQPFLISPDWALWSIIVIASWVGLGYWMVFLIAGLQDIPRDLLESASVDGATWWGSFRHIVVPLMRRPLLFVLVADSVSNFLLFVQVQLLTEGGPAGSTNVLMHEIYKQAFVFGNQTTAAAEVLILVALMGLIVAIQVRMMGSED